MRIVPVLALKDGQVTAEAQVRTFNRAIEVMIATAVGQIRDYGATRLLVMHTNAADLAARVAQDLRSRLSSPVRSLRILEAGPVIAVHAGPGAVGVFYLDDRVP